MRVSVFGLGYVGTVSGVCLAKEGHQVIGVDKNVDKVKQLNARQTPIVEPGINDIISQTVSNGSFRATTDAGDAIMNSDITLIAVGTYSSADGSANLQSIYHVMDEIGAGIKDKNTYHSIVIRSTVPPGTTEVSAGRVERASGKKNGFAFGLGMNPEFLREGVALNDFYNPPFIVIGTEDKKTADTVKQLYGFLTAAFHHVETRQAEILKYSCNAFHGLKVAFANEMGRICKASGVDGRQLMKIFTEDTILNISSKYLMPGIPFGGSCLPKDIKALASFADSKGVRVPLLNENFFMYAEEKDLAWRLNKNGYGCYFVPGAEVIHHGGKSTDQLAEPMFLELQKSQIKFFNRHYRGIKNRAMKASYWFLLFTHFTASLAMPFTKYGRHRLKLLYHAVINYSRYLHA